MFDKIKKYLSGNDLGKSTGAFLNHVDDRDIMLASFTKPRTALLKFITDITALPVEDQMQEPDCVGQAEGFVVEFYIWKVTKKLVRISRRFIYAMSKTKDNDPRPGTQPRFAAQVITNYYGAATTDTVPDNNTLPYSEFIKVQLTGRVLDDAQKNKLPGFAGVARDENSICQAIEDHDVMTATLAVDPNSWFYALIQRVFRIDSYHRIVFYGHELIGGRRKIYFRNHWSEQWGNRGNGEIWLDEYLPYMYDLQVYTEIPADLLLKAQTTNYQFKNPIVYGDTGLDVYKLQQRLQKAGYLKGVDISSLEPSFGNLTAAALLAFQIENRIDTVANLQALRGRSAGPKTLKFLNTGDVARVSRLNDWAMAIQSFEGWYAGSTSFRHNNPGNLRKSSLEIGNDGFSIFKDYETGFKALMNLLTNAVNGTSSIYNPNMTLLDFYNKYAPGSDNNNPSVYASYVAKSLGVPIETQIKNLA